MCHKGELPNNLRNVALPVGFHAGRHLQGRSAQLSGRLPQSRRNKTPRKCLHGGYMAPKTEKACRSFLKQQAFVFIGGEGGIRTHGRVAPTPDFESGTFDHSATSPASCRGEILAEAFDPPAPNMPSAREVAGQGARDAEARGRCGARRSGSGCRRSSCRLR